MPLPGSTEVSHVLVPAAQGKTTTVFRGQYIAVLWNADAEESVDDFEATLRVGLAGGYRNEKFKYFGARVLVSVPSRRGTRKSSSHHWWAVLVRFEHRVSRSGRWLELPGVGNMIRVGATDIISSAYIPHWVEAPKARLGVNLLRSWIDSWQCWISTQASDQEFVFGDKLDTQLSVRSRKALSEVSEVGDSFESDVEIPSPQVVIPVASAPADTDETHDRVLRHKIDVLEEQVRSFSAKLSTLEARLNLLERGTLQNT